MKHSTTNQGSSVCGVFDILWSLLCDQLDIGARSRHLYGDLSWNDNGEHQSPGPPNWFRQASNDATLDRADTDSDVANDSVTDVATKFSFDFAYYAASDVATDADSDVATNDRAVVESLVASNVTSDIAKDPNPDAATDSASDVYNYAATDSASDFDTDFDPDAATDY